MVSVPPAYSAPFHETRLVNVAALDSIHRITRRWAWEGSTGEGVKIAILDSGVDATHPQVGPIHGYVSISEGADGKLIYDTDPHDDSYGHGTACAGIIRSIAPDCEIYSVKVLGSGLTGNGRVFEAGLRWAIDNGVQICNLSLGTKRRELFGVFHELADKAYFNNVVLITAANNNPVASFPSLYSSVISVASHGIKDPEHTYYYNPKPPVEFGAYGIDVRVAWINHKYMTLTGNSFAAPHMTGLVAAILGKHPGLTIFQLKTILRELANNVDRPEDPSLGVPLDEERNNGEANIVYPTPELSDS